MSFRRTRPPPFMSPVDLPHAGEPAQSPLLASLLAQTTRLEIRELMVMPVIQNKFAMSRSKRAKSVGSKTSRSADSSRSRRSRTTCSPTFGQVPERRAGVCAGALFSFPSSVILIKLAVCALWEEPLNCSAWTYVAPRIQTTSNETEHRKSRYPKYAGRDPTGLVVTGSKLKHKKEVEQLTNDAMARGKWKFDKD
ncbi:2-oxoglutarate dehydrogenase E1 component, partial [Ceratobasidium sp. 392]